jgi:hypothetical protein
MIGYKYLTSIHDHDPRFALQGRLELSKPFLEAFSNYRNKFKEPRDPFLSWNLLYVNDCMSTRNVKKDRSRTVPKNLWSGA